MIDDTPALGPDDHVLTGTISVAPAGDRGGIEIFVVDDSGDRYVLPLDARQLRLLMALAQDAVDLAASGPFIH